MLAGAVEDPRAEPGGGGAEQHEPAEHEQRAGEGGAGGEGVDDRARREGLRQGRDAGDEGDGERENQRPAVGDRAPARRYEPGGSGARRRRTRVPGCRCGTPGPGSRRVGQLAAVAALSIESESWFSDSSGNIPLKPSSVTPLQS